MMTTTLNLSNQGLTVMPDLSGYPNLTVLNLNDNLLTDVGILPNTLKELYLQNNRISSIVVPPNLLVLNILDNRLSMMDVPQTLTTLSATFKGHKEQKHFSQSLLELSNTPNTIVDMEWGQSFTNVYIYSNE